MIIKKIIRFCVEGFRGMTRGGASLGRCCFFRGIGMIRDKADIAMTNLVYTICADSYSLENIILIYYLKMASRRFSSPIYDKNSTEFAEL